LKLFSFSAQNTSLHAVLAFNVSFEKSAVILMGLPLYVTCFFSYSLKYSLFSVLDALMIIFHGEVLFWSSLFSIGGFLYLNGHNFLEIWEIFCYLFIEYIMNPFCLNLFSFFNGYDSQVWSFDGVGEFLYIPLTSLELFD
jgi:hypothetical protein